MVKRGKKTLAVVEDEPALRRLLMRWLADEGYSVLAFEDGESFLAELPRLLPDAVVLDLGLPGIDGFEVLRRSKEEHPDVPVIMLTGREDPDTIVNAMRLGAFEYLVKPMSLPRLATTVRNAAEQREMTNRVRELETRVEGGSIPGIHGSSPVMLALLAQMKRVAGTDVSVLIRGESGSGKELVARALHTLGRRPNGPFVAINCAAVPESLQESELFGHERGAFTGATGRRVGRFEQANGGTLFLDEAGELSAALQAKLLRVLQERTFHRVGGHDEVRSDFRLVAATNRDLALDAREGRFREDLYYRMAVFELVVPSLRERGDDIVIIARVLARDLGMKVRGQPSEIPPDTAAALRAYGWPGNVRELENAIQHALVVSPGAVISPWSLPTGIAPRRPGEAQPLVPAVPASAGPAATVSRGDVSAGAPPHDREAPARVPAPGRGTDADLWESMLAGLTLEEIERRAVEAAVRRHGGNRSRAADELGIARTTLYRKLGEL